ncbi:MAG: oligosaccharide flippase family protein [Bacteroidales bacterium]
MPRPAGDADTGGEAAIVWEWDEGRPIATLARNVGTRYIGIVVEAVVGLVVLPFNVHHLGASAYGLWMLTASVTAYFSVMDLGYAGSLVRFVARYRARRDARAINEILSTLFFVFALLGTVAYAVAVFLAFRLGTLFHLSPDDARVGRDVLLVVSANVALGFCFSVFGGVINGFQRYHLNNLVGALTSLLAGVANVAVLLAGYHLVPVVLATTTVRIAALFVYRWNAYYVFPALHIRPSHFHLSRLREVTGFSVFILLLDWANKINYSVDAIVIGGFLNTAAVAVWTVAQRLAEVSQRVTNQLNDILFPAIVDSDEGQRTDRLRRIFLSATRLSVASVIPVGGGLLLLARPLIAAWVGPRYAESVLVTQLLAAVVMVRVGNATATTVLKGAGGHKLLTATNLTTAAGNLIVSLLLVRRLGLAGVALGTLIPVSLAALFVLFPAACRRADVLAWRALRTSVWPALWPGLFMAAWLVATRSSLAVNLAGVVLDGAIGGVIYALLFVGFAIPADERRIFVGEARNWLRGRLAGQGPGSVDSSRRAPAA